MGWCILIELPTPANIGVFFSRMTGINASAFAVPRNRKSETTCFSSMSFCAFSTERFGSKPSSSDSSTIFLPLTPPCAFTRSK